MRLPQAVGWIRRSVIDKAIQGIAWPLNKSVTHRHFESGDWVVHHRELHDLVARSPRGLGWTVRCQSLLPQLEKPAAWEMPAVRKLTWAFKQSLSVTIVVLAAAILIGPRLLGG